MCDISDGNPHRYITKKTQYPRRKKNGMTGLWFQLVYKELCFTATKSVGGKLAERRTAIKRNTLKTASIMWLFTLAVGWRLRFDVAFLYSRQVPVL